MQTPRRTITIGSGRRPRLDLDATRGPTLGSELHEQAIAQLSRPGRLTLEHAHPTPRGQGISPGWILPGRSRRPCSETPRTGESSPDAKDGAHHAVVERGVQGRASLLFDDPTDRGERSAHLIPGVLSSRGPDRRAFLSKVVG